jgi:hypothetical protein
LAVLRDRFVTVEGNGLHSVRAIVAIDRIWCDRPINPPYNSSKIHIDIESTWRRATELHLKGELSGAEALYSEVLRAQPRNAGALHIEDAYTQMYERNQADLNPDHIEVPQ